MTGSYAHSNGVYINGHSDPDPSAPGFVTVAGVRNKRYKYIEGLNLTNDINELYDLQTDPGEMDNKINSPEYESVKAEMIKELARLKAETGFFDPKMYVE